MAKIKTFDTATVYLTAAFKMQMEKVTQYPCTLVEAPMGYGKTTGVRAFFKNTKVRVLEQRLRDDSLSGFWKYFCHLFRELDGDCYESLQHIGFPVNGTAKEMVLGFIQKALPSEPIVLVLGDYHLADNPEVNDFMEYLLWNELPGLHIVLTARYTRLNNLDELVLKGYLQHIQKESLEFTPEEIKSYYRLCGVTLQEKEVKNLHTYTEGWISALYLLMLSYRDEGILTGSPNISRLIEKTVYTPFSQEIRDFLVHICFLDSFTIEQASHMWQKGNTKELLDAIVGRNAFISYDEKTEIYQVHRIFSEFLQELTKRMEPKEKDELNRRMAAWFAKTGEYISALRCYYLAGDWDALFTVLEVDQGHSILNEHREELISFYEECPVPIREQHPVALLVIAICLFSYNEMVRFAAVCEEIGALLRSASRENQSLCEIEGELELLLSFTKYNDLEKMGEHIKAACNLMERPAKFMDTRGGWTFGSPSVLYMFHREAGQLLHELKLMRETLPYYDLIAKGHGAGADHIMDAEISYLCGKFDDAEILVHKALYYASLCKQQDILICAVFLQIKMGLYKGDYAYAAYNLQKIREQTEKGIWYHLLDTIDLCQAFLLASLGQKQDIPEWIINGNYHFSKLHFPALPFFNIIYGHVLLVREEYHKLLGSMDYFMENAALFPNLLAQIYTHIYAAAANEKLHRRVEALAELTKALKLAHPDLLLMPFVEHCGGIETLLAELYRRGMQKEFISSILGLYEPYKQAIKSITAEYFTRERPVLTEREAEIAQLVAQGLSNKEIGQQLYITENTVKTILKHIFQKLGIGSRALLKQYVDSERKEQ
ncbi:LuxR C-terminal-related transcriptional regulator [Anaerotignum propionicum]|uniref:LuxR C-terminal-related transcriptional regulator n=1 Tax=Anaerotignum propionicum TaxID=28446 RepID=UPI00210D78EE|nr:LuxR C-terminal-related transcriptional regulator [Anaerotignum propionicum]MCQ4936384.1 LuxR C-terminal-related transcriptional regulator [Anaerotignum propionicum]